MRPIAKERLEKLAHIINSSANQALNLQEFHWLKEDRLKASGLPDVYKQHAGSRDFSAEMWKRFKETGTCVNVDELRAIEANLTPAE